MSQFDFGIINPNVEDGTGLAADLNAWRDAVHSGHKGGSRPAYVVAGMTWVNDTSNPWLEYYYDGSNDIEKGRIDVVSNTYTATAATSMEATTDTFITTTSTTYYLTSVKSTDIDDLDVSLGGVEQTANVDFTYNVSVKSITFTSAIPEGIRLTVRGGALTGGGGGASSWDAITGKPSGLQGGGPSTSYVGADLLSHALGNSAFLNTGTTGSTVALGNHNHSGVYEPVISAAPTNAYGKFWMGDKTWAKIPSYCSGVLDGCVLSATNGTSLFSVSAGVVQIVDEYTDYTTVTYSTVTFNGVTGVSDAYASSTATYIGINASGTIVQQITPFTADQLRDIVSVGVIAKSDGLIIALAGIVDTVYEADNFARDLQRSIGSIVNGCKYSGNSGLTFARASGTLFRPGAHYSVDKKTPNEVPIATQATVSFSIYSRNSSNTVFSNSALSTTLNPAVYDNGGASTLGIPTGSVSTNSWQAIRLWLSTNGNTLAQYGAAVYNSLQAAKDGVQNEIFYPAPVTSLTAFRGYLFVRGGATNLNTSSDAVFVNAGKFGETFGIGGSSSGIVDLTSGVTGVLPVANGGTGTSTPSLVQGTNITISGTWPNQTISASGGSGSFDGNLAADLNITGVARRITGDFSNATKASRLLFKSSTTNGNTIVGAVPNGTSAVSSYATFGGSDPDNAQRFMMQCFGGIGASFISTYSGTPASGTYLPVTFNVGGSDRVTIGTSGSFTVPDIYSSTSANAANVYVDSAGRLIRSSYTTVIASNPVFTGGAKEAKSDLSANNIDCNAANYFSKTIFANTTFTVSNVPSSGTVASFILDLTIIGSYTITWWANTKWAGGVAPMLPMGRNVLGFFTHDGGTTWTGVVLGKDVK